jgi:hypothetical protein
MQNQKNIIGGQNDTHADFKNLALDRFEYMVRTTRDEDRSTMTEAQEKVIAWLYPAVGITDLKKSIKKLSKETYKKIYDASEDRCENMYDVWI